MYWSLCACRLAPHSGSVLPAANERAPHYILIQCTSGLVKTLRIISREKVVVWKTVRTSAMFDFFIYFLIQSDPRGTGYIKKTGDDSFKICTFWWRTVSKWLQTYNDRECLCSRNLRIHSWWIWRMSSILWTTYRHTYLGRKAQISEAISLMLHLLLFFKTIFFWVVGLITQEYIRGLGPHVNFFFSSDFKVRILRKKSQKSDFNLRIKIHMWP